MELHIHFGSLAQLQGTIGGWTVSEPLRVDAKRTGHWRSEGELSELIGENRRYPFSFLIQQGNQASGDRLVSTKLQEVTAENLRRGRRRSHDNQEEGQGQSLESSEKGLVLVATAKHSATSLRHWDFAGTLNNAYAERGLE